MKQIRSSWYRSKNELPIDSRHVAVSDGFDCTTGFYGFNRGRWFVDDITAVIPSQVEYWTYLPGETNE